MWTVYEHINRINNKRYFGITSQDPKNRWGRGSTYKGCVYFYNAIKEYGWDTFDHIIIKSGLPEQCAKSLEKILIKYYDTTNPDKGYNLSKGGDGFAGYNHTEYSKKKISDALKKITTSSRFTEGNTPWNKGIHLSKETKQKISLRNKGNCANNKAVIKYDLNGNELERFPSAKIAIESVGGNVEAFRRAIRTTNHYKNYIWKYE